MATTPFLLFDINRLRENARRFHQQASSYWSNYRAYYAIKANPDARILKVLAQENFGFEVMSAVQLEEVRDLKTEIIASGFCKSARLIGEAPRRCQYLVVEGAHELLWVKRAASPVNLILRVKLEQGAKLGCSIEDVRAFIRASRQNENVRILGVHYHAGWNIRDNEKIRDCLKTLVESFIELQTHGLNPRIINLGGSFCEDSVDPSQLKERFEIYKTVLGDIDAEIHFEPGRYLVGDSGTLISNIYFVDLEKYHLYVDTCAYGYRLSAGTPKAKLLGTEYEVEDEHLWNIYGFWPAEGDQCKMSLRGRPQIGNRLALENMGAYTWDMPMQFDSERGLEVKFCGN